MYFSHRCSPFFLLTNGEREKKRRKMKKRQGFQRFYPLNEMHFPKRFFKCFPFFFFPTMLSAWHWQFLFVRHFFSLSFVRCEIRTWFFIWHCAGLVFSLHFLLQTFSTLMFIYVKLFKELICSTFCVFTEQIWKNYDGSLCCYYNCFYENKNVTKSTLTNHDVVLLIFLAMKHGPKR